MKTVGAYEAKTHLAKLLDEVTKGQTITITKHGQPVAKLIPIKNTSKRPEDIIELLKSARKGIKLGTLSIASLKNEGRR